MKKLFTILAVASMMLTSVFGFSSCTNDDSDYNRATQQTSLQAQQPVKQNAYLYTVGTEEQKNYIDIVYVVDVDGKTQEISQSQMTQVDNSEFSTAMQLVHAFDSIGSKVDAKIYKYNLGAVGSAEVVAVKGKALVDKADHEINVVYGYSVRVGSSKFGAKEDAEIYKGLDDIKTFASDIH